MIWVFFIISGFMAEEWGLYIQDFAPKIKKFVTSAVASGEVIQTKGMSLDAYKND